MRLFIAIDFNELEDFFVKLQALLPKNASLSLAKRFHLTLKFLGEVQPDKAEAIVRILKDVKFQKFRVFLSTIGVFPADGNARVVWVGLEPEGKILELQSQIDNSLKSLFNGYKSFKAHITLARVRYLEDKGSFVKESKGIKIEKKSIEISHFKLIKSILTPKGPIYEELEDFISN